ncbi:hypothetical protein [Haloglomus litoreum]|uniref:hypothetical protein n=1 Tax=Haloglomus litoreum TaxID=3034026 RepID=UPI0023E89B3C|nr:hypothetical protein [Haloglomus sp. DT116]
MTDDQRTLDSSFESANSNDDSTETASSGAAEGDRVTDRNRVLVKLTREAAKTDAELLEKRTTSSGSFSYPSVAAAEAALITNEEVKLQSAAANEDRYDYYVVRTRPPEPAPAERGAPADGWSVQARGNEVGALAQALIAGVGRRPTPIVHYTCRDLGVENEALQFRKGTSLDQFTPIETPSNHSWVPDAVFAVYDRTEWNSIESERRDTGQAGADEHRLSPDELSHEREERALRRVYPIEVKHDNASFGRSQRQAMNALTALDDERVVPLLIRVTLDDLPQHYDVRIRPGPFGDSQ